MFKKVKKTIYYVLAIYTILGFLVFPLVLKTQLINLIQAETNSKVSINKIYFNPYTFVLKVSEVELKSLNDKPLVSVKLIGVNLEPSSLIKAALHIKTFILQEPKITFVYNKDKSINLTSILKLSKSEKTDNNTTTKLPRIILDKISIENGSIDYENYTHKNKFDFSLNQLGLDLKNVDTNDINKSNATLAFYTKFSDGGSINLKSEVVGFEPFILKGSLDLQSTKVYTPWRYIQDDLNIEVADGKLSLYADYYTNLQDLNSTILKNANIHLDNLRLKPKSKSKDILTLNSFYIKGATIKPMQADVHLNQIGINSLDANVKKSKNGKIDWLEYVKISDKKLNKDIDEAKNIIKEQEDKHKVWSAGIENIALKNVNLGFMDNSHTPNAFSKLNNFKLSIPSISLDKFKARSQKEDEQESFRATADKLNLDSAKLTFKDEALSGAPKTTIDKINLTAHSIDSKKMSWLKYDMSLRLNKKGYITSEGKLSHTPLKQEGTLKVSKLSLKDITPYIQKDAFISIDGGYLNLNTKTKYAHSEKKADLSINGYLDIRNFFLTDSRDKTSLLSFNKLSLNDLYIKLLPNRVYVNRVNLNSFYINAVVNKDKSMNLSSLSKKTSKDKKPAIAKNKITKKTQSDFKVNIKKVKVSNGSAKFADLSLPIEFRTNIHNLNGEIRTISNTTDQNSYVNITGEVNKYGSTKLEGNINSFNPKAYTNLNLNFKNLDLSSLSGYSAAFAGYKIDDGKLYLDLGYNILNSTLKSSNSIVIKKIKLGDTIKDENVSTLPLGFVIGLLEDDEGIIDIDLPIEGDMDEPNFRYGALVWKTLTGLIAKAISSPFNFLGSMLGLDGDKLEAVKFEAGVSEITAPEKEKLNTIAKIMKKRPKIELLISATYDETIDKYALAKAKVDTLIMKESGVKNENNIKNLITIDILEDIYEELKDDDGLKKIEDTLDEKYSGDEFDAAYIKAAYEACISAQSVAKEELENLAKIRADNLINYLTAKENIASRRIIKSTISKINDSDREVVKTKLQIEVK